jgi:peptidoglycan hydrolase-like protein with peptidoglycan-binding domain
VLSIRTSVTVALAAAMIVTPAFAAPAHRKTAGSHPLTASHAAKGSRAASTPHAKSSSQAAASAAQSSASNRGAGLKGKHGKMKGAIKPLRMKGQQAIQPERVTEIQQALIREHYLTSEANGKWDDETQAAMQKFQADQGWQTKLMPDSRALKKLGLGPDYSNAINAKSSSFVEPAATGTTSPDQASGFASAAGISR